MTEMTESDLPEIITRPCCPGKSCGDVQLELRATAVLIDGEAVKVWSYNRDNGWNGYADGDAYYGPERSLEALAQQAGLER